MKILVPIKRVPDPYAKLRPLADSSGIDLTGVKMEINPFDEIAMESAVRLKEADPSIEIVSVSIGEAVVEEQLRKSLAMGADKAILLESNSPIDAQGVAKNLAAVVTELQIDLVLMGKQATDDDHNEVGQRLAAILDWPQATFAAAIKLSGNQVEVTRETDSGSTTVSLPLPCVITADLRLAEPRYIALPGIIKARSKPLERRVATNFPVQILTAKVEALAPRTAGRKVASVDELISALRGMGAIK